MSEPIVDEQVLKRVLKDALIEALEDRRELFREIFTEVFEDLALMEGIGDDPAKHAAAFRGFLTSHNGEA